MNTPRPRRLEHVWVKRPVFFVTTVVKDRRHVLANDRVFEILQDQFRLAKQRYGWAVGEFVIMPDHIHFFTREATGNSKTLSDFVGQIKSWSSKRYKTVSPEIPMPLWQEGFFDRLMRSERDWEEKRLYMLDNPVRAGLVEKPADWLYKGDFDMFAD